MAVMGGLLSGGAPLRGRASLELVIGPFGYRDAANFWGISDPRLAVLVHSIVGGTPASRRESSPAVCRPALATSTPGYCGRC